MEINNKDEFLDTFLSHYLNRGFGSLSKNEIDVLLMHLILENSDLKNKSNYDVSIKLKITEARVKSLKHKSKLLFIEDPDVFVKREFLRLLGNAKLQGEQRQGESGKVLMVIEGSYLKQGIQGKLKELGHFADNSFNSEIVKISQESFIALLESFYKQLEIESFVQEVNDVIPDENRIEFKPLFKKFLDAVATKSGEKIVELGTTYLTGGLSDIASLTDKVKTFFIDDKS